MNPSRHFYFLYWISIECKLVCQGKVVVEAAKGEKIVLPDEEVIENKEIKNWSF